MHVRQMRFLALAGALVMAAGACSSSTGGSSASAVGAAAASRPAPVWTRPTKTITLGVLTPLSGPAALIGNPLTNGQKAYFDS